MTELQILEYNNQRLLTTDQLAEFYGTTPTRIKQNFGYNREKFVEGKHYYFLKGPELKEFKDTVGNSDLVGKNANSLLLYTKQGASRHSKMLGTDQAWDMFDELEENYFNPPRMHLPTSQRELAKLALAANEETNERVDKVEKDIINLRDNQVLGSGDYSYISRRIHQRVSEVAKGFGHVSNSQRGELYRDINSGVKRIAGVGSRTQLRTKHYERVVEFIQDWEPSTATKSIVRQMSLDLAE